MYIIDQESLAYTNKWSGEISNLSDKKRLKQFAITVKQQRFTGFHKIYFQLN